MDLKKIEEMLPKYLEIKSDIFFFEKDTSL